MTRIEVRRGKASDWRAANPTLAAGEPGLETDTGNFKLGDGVTVWEDLACYQSRLVLDGVFGAQYRFEDEGAVGDGIADDSAAISHTLAKLKPGDRLFVTPGKTFTHSDVIAITVPGIQIFGGGTLRATDEARSAIQIKADSVTVDNIHSTVSASSRGSTLAHHAWVIDGADGVTLRRIAVDGSKAAGIFVRRATNYRLDSCSVMNTLADGFHHTGGSSGGLVTYCSATNTGDDGHAVISYGKDAQECSDIRCVGFRLQGQRGGRGMSVVGGRDITLQHFQISDSYGASIYINVESGFKGISDVRVEHGILVRGNRGWRSGLRHGVVLIGNNDVAASVTRVVVSDIESVDAGNSMGAGSGRTITVEKPGAGSVSEVRLERIYIRGARPYSTAVSPPGMSSIFQDIDLGRLTTVNRVPAKRACNGATYWDTTLGIRAYCNGARWKNGAGTVI